MTSRRRMAIAGLEQAIGHVFQDRELLERALTHASVGEGAREVRHYERLEFLGDRVINLLAAERLLAMDAAATEGQMSPRLAELVNGKACARVARRIGLAEAIRLSPGETKSGGRDKDTILGDACEALMAAVFIDAGLDAARNVFARAWSAEFDSAARARAKEPKTELQEWAQARGRTLPFYNVIKRDGPDHAPVFTVEVTVDGYPPESGQGRSRQEAEKAAALALLLRREGGQ
ncbi:MAG TPA: ribonuclease III [Caulobacteraceae bacterium]|nr:ribonuclease III [Caulobacteraceae bacterium]